MPYFQKLISLFREHLLGIISPMSTDIKWEHDHPTQSVYHFPDSMITTLAQCQCTFFWCLYCWLWARLYKYFLANVPIKQKLGNWFLEKLNCFLCDGNIDGQLFSKSAKRTLVKVHRTCSSVFHVHFEQDLVHPKKLLGIFP